MFGWGRGEQSQRDFMSEAQFLKQEYLQIPWNVYSQPRRLYPIKSAESGQDH